MENFANFTIGIYGIIMMFITTYGMHTGDNFNSTVGNVYIIKSISNFKVLDMSNDDNTDGNPVSLKNEKQSDNRSQMWNPVMTTTTLGTWFKFIASSNNDLLLTSINDVAVIHTNPDTLHHSDALNQFWNIELNPSNTIKFEYYIRNVKSGKMLEWSSDTEQVILSDHVVDKPEQLWLFFEVDWEMPSIPTVDNNANKLCTPKVGVKYGLFTEDCFIKETNYMALGITDDVNQQLYVTEFNLFNDKEGKMYWYIEPALNGYIISSASNSTIYLDFENEQLLTSALPFSDSDILPYPLWQIYPTLGDIPSCYIQSLSYDGGWKVAEYTSGDNQAILNEKDGGNSRQRWVLITTS